MDIWRKWEMGASYQQKLTCTTRSAYWEREQIHLCHHMCERERERTYGGLKGGSRSTGIKHQMKSNTHNIPRHIVGKSFNTCRRQLMAEIFLLQMSVEALLEVNMREPEQLTWGWSREKVYYNTRSLPSQSPTESASDSESLNTGTWPVPLWLLFALYVLPHTNPMSLVWACRCHVCWNEYLTLKISLSLIQIDQLSRCSCWKAVVLQSWCFFMKTFM